MEQQSIDHAGAVVVEGKARFGAPDQEESREEEVTKRR
jgi:hypothetical protein